MAREAYEILREVLYEERAATAAEIAGEIFGPKRGFDLPPIPPFAMREPPNFDE